MRIGLSGKVWVCRLQGNLGDKSWAEREDGSAILGNSQPSCQAARRQGTVPSRAPLEAGVLREDCSLPLFDSVTISFGQLLPAQESPSWKKLTLFFV